MFSHTSDLIVLFFAAVFGMSAIGFWTAYLAFKVAASEARRVKKVTEMEVVKLVSAEHNNGVSVVVLYMKNAVSQIIHSIKMEEDGSVFVLLNQPFEADKKALDPVMCYALKIEHNDPFALIKLNLINDAVNNSECDLSFELSVIDKGEALTFALIDKIKSLRQQK